MASCISLTRNAGSPQVITLPKQQRGLAVDDRWRNAENQRSELADGPESGGSLCVVEGTFPDEGGVVANRQYPRENHHGANTKRVGEARKRSKTR